MTGGRLARFVNIRGPARTHRGAPLNHMTEEKFAEIVRGLEDFARREPGKYSLRVALLAALGYAYPLLIIAIVLALLAGLVYITLTMGRLNRWLIWLGWLLAAFAFFVARSMWVKVPEPEGTELKREEAPRLFALADELTEKLKTPRIDHVVVDDEYNAALAQVPRLGPLGFYRNYLVVGLPLALALTPEQFRAVMAHEVGHMSGRQGRFAEWIYRVRAGWMQLLARFEQEQQFGSFIFEWFVKWYSPYFSAYTFVLARRHEYEADAASARLTSPQTAGEALVVSKARAGVLAKFWPDVFKHADDEPKPPRGVMRRMAGALAAGADESDVETLLRASLKEETGYDDTHPSLAARLAALGFEGEARERAVAEWAQRLSAPRGESAAEHYLAGVHERVAERFDVLWAEAVGQRWRERHEYANEARARLAALDEKAASAPLSADEECERAYLVAEFRTGEEAVPLLRRVLELDPAHAGANFALGQLLLGQGDESGISHLQRAGERDPTVIHPGAEAIYSFYKGHGRDEEAEEYRRGMQATFEQLMAADRERESYRDGEELLPHDMPPEQVALIRERLAGIEEVKAAYLARKRLEHFPEKPIYVLGIESALPWHKRSNEAEARLVQEVINRGGGAIPERAFIVSLRAGKWTDAAIRQLEDALIYER